MSSAISAIGIAKALSMASKRQRYGRGDIRKMHRGKHGRKWGKWRMRITNPVYMKTLVGGNGKLYEPNPLQFARSGGTSAYSRVVSWQLSYKTPRQLARRRVAPQGQESQIRTRCRRDGGAGRVCLASLGLNLIFENPSNPTYPYVATFR